ncbi:Cof subfamily protein (haloacid dehalogenase superfamily) [Pullulanibacillus pueri]|uniref:Hydrolase n=1 Tax=Pullulanibacillus pueri TaxID=1437324 RepID=A0A8J3A023_9BACL|nr:Cof-type HAD-IIB family hydrolase [Pullulanibacillus pueri]MBM7680564.1 Cof subfamily protein (haloacid dehalogenase superfamily) [Pullulanibacillus pueri]GGH88442.1 hydrolase [Pullulanibacillus pueri]
MNRYLIVLDLDGTLLTSEKNIDPRTKEVIQKVMEAGHIVMIATGRPFRASKAYYEELHLNTPIVNFNGAYIHHPHQPEWGTIHSPLELETLKGILETCDHYELTNIFIEVKDHVYINNPDPLVADLFEIGNPTITYGPIQEKLKEAPTSVLLQTNEQQTKAVLHALDTEYSEAIEQRSWGKPSNIIEVIKRGVNKAVGIKKVAQDYNIPPERIIAFGDEDNDKEMISYAGQGVAMGNAIAELKALADAVTESNDDTGIANYLERTFLL